MAGHEEARLDTGHFLGKLGILLSDIVWKDVGLAIKVVQLRVLALAAFGGVTESGDEETVVVEGVDGGGSGISNILALLELDIVGVATASDAEFGRLFSAVGTEKRLPVLGDAEDDIGTPKGFDEGGRVVQLSLNHLDPESGQLFSRGGLGVASEAAHLKA